MCQHMLAAANALETEIVERLAFCSDRECLCIKIDDGIGSAVPLPIIIDKALVAAIEITEAVAAIHTTDRDDHSIWCSVSGSVECINFLGCV